MVIKMETRWELLTPPDFRKHVSEHKTCILPIGSLERHGEHLPFGTDSLIAHAIAVGASKLEPCVVFPVYHFGQVHEAACFAGTVNFPMAMCLQVLELLLDQIANNGFEKIIILNGHGGNSHMLEYFAMSQLDREVKYTLYITKDWGMGNEEYEKLWETESAHACEEETSLVMAIEPDSVKLNYQRFSEPVEPKTDLSYLKDIHTGLWWYAKYPENIAGSPSKASFDKGKKAIEICIHSLADRIKTVKDDVQIPALQKEFYKRCNDVHKNL